MRLDIVSPRGEAPPDAATVAAIIAALSAVNDAARIDVSVTAPAPSAWRTAGRSVAAFGGYDAARHDVVRRRGRAQ